MTEKSLEPLLDFTPVPRKPSRHRHDGMTPDRQRRFIAALAETGSVSAAARRVGVCNATAYQLYHHAEAGSFRAAWDRALEIGVGRIHDVAMERALDGVAKPVYYRGEQVGEERRFSDRVLVTLLRHHAFGHHPSPAGRWSKAAIERRAAENCPVCRERREAETAAAETALSSAEDRLREGAEQMLDHYGHKVAAERRHRLAGEIVAADFYVRQLSVLEVMMERCGMSDVLHVYWGDAMDELLSAVPTDFARELDAIKQRVWAAAGDPPRPDPRLDPDLNRCGAMHGGATVMQRHAIQKAAAARIAEAQAEWEAAAHEETWAAWKARREGLPPPGAA